MGRALEVEIVAKEAIKPSYPTPHYLRNFKRSLMDQINYPMYTTGIFIYKVNDDDDLSVKAGRISRRLKSSLSETLTKFYPFAGKVKDDFSIECNDDGVEFIEGRANGFLSQYLQEPDHNLLSEFHPFGKEGPVAGKDSPLLIVQATFFKCGGVAIATCASHVLIDGMSLATFINCWAATARVDDHHQPSKLPASMLPQYVTASLFPASEAVSSYPLRFSPSERVEFNRFVFDASKIAQLKAEAASEIVPRPSTVEAITALIWKCTRTASRSNHGGSPRPSLLLQGANFRTELVPPLPDNSVGNCVGYAVAQTGEKETKLQDLVCELRRAKEEFSRNGLQTLLENKCLLTIQDQSIRDKFESGEIDFFSFTSVVRFPFYQAADFGWGKPIHVTFLNFVSPNFFMLMATNDGTGVEALVSLSPEDMVLFQRNQELLAFATLNPPVDVNEAKNVSLGLRSSL
ncbi:hypothetical protein WN943_027679 [Citrus x changshan-huyou]